MAGLFYTTARLFSILSLTQPVFARVSTEASTGAKVGTKSNLTSSSPLYSPLAREMMYTQNSLCRQNYCVNPLFPGINDLPRLEALQWQCATTSMVHQHMDFCKDAVPYDPALPSPVSKSTAVSALVKAQEDAAMTMFVYHLNGMGYEAWDYQTPSASDNECVRSVWKMVCFTYFPRAEAGCKEGEQSAYKRPCKSSCHSYIKQCGVECCDESIQCVFSHTKESDNGTINVLQTGYVDEVGPSASCTGTFSGGARQSMSSPMLMLLAIFGFHWATSASVGSTKTNAVEARQRPRGLSRFFCVMLIGALALLLQGCDTPIPQHAVGNWRTKPNYLNQFKYLPTGADGNHAVLNSCSQPDASATTQCNGRGYCRAFSKTFIATEDDNTPLSFCECDRDWADPECGTERKSQMTAFFLSLFLGFVGADYFYLGFPVWALGKLFTLGGLGVWWLIDIMRTASGPVYAYNFRTSQDLPHYLAILILVFIGMLIGFCIAIETYLTYRKARREDLARLEHDEESRHFKETKADLAQMEGPRFRSSNNANFQGRPGFSGYGATMPMTHPNANAPYAIPGNTPYGGLAGPYGPAGVLGQGSPTPASIR